MPFKNIIREIKENKNEIKSIFFVGCGASKAELYPGKYFLENKAKKLRISHYTANEFNYATPASVDESAIVITCSLGGNTPETVQATSLAKQLGASVIAVTNTPESPITKDAEHIVIHDFDNGYSAKVDKMTKVLRLAVEVLNQFEGYEDYDDMMSSLDKIYGFVDNAVLSVKPQAEEFARKYKDAPMIYLMSSGATHEVAYSFSICLMMEMQLINSGSFHDGEFFHGPFEIVEKNVPFILLMNDGKTRPMDSRALDFLNRFGALTTVIDSKDYGLASIAKKSVIDYLNPMLITGLLRVHAEEISKVRNHPLTKRRYMWKIDY